MTGGGFAFDLLARNAALEARGVKAPGFKKTGTTIVGLVFKVKEVESAGRGGRRETERVSRVEWSALSEEGARARLAGRGCPRDDAPLPTRGVLGMCRRPYGLCGAAQDALSHAARDEGRTTTTKSDRAARAPSFSSTCSPSLSPQDGVVLGADTRSTAGSTVADKNCEKIHFIAPNIYCCGAGTATDTENVTGMVASALELHRHAAQRASRVVTALTLLKSHLFRYQGHVSAALVLGGVDAQGPHLFTVYPHGSTDALPFATMGSGSLNAMAVFEAGYRDGMTADEAVALVTEAIRSGVLNDLGSGSNIDICVITKEGVDYRRNAEFLQAKTYERQHPKELRAGGATVLRERLQFNTRAK